MMKEPRTRDELVALRDATVVKEGVDATVVVFHGRLDGTYAARCTCGWLSQRLGDTGKLNSLARKHYQEAHQHE